MIITIAGKPGSGKSSVAKILAKKLKLEKFSAGDFRRQMAKDRGLSIQELNKLGEKEDFTDKDADNWQAEIGKTKDNFVIDGRLSYYFIPNSVKIFLDVSPEIGAKRIMPSRRKEEKMNSIKEAVQMWHERVNSDIKRYKKYYKINPYNKEQFDLVINTTSLTIKQTAEKILNYLNSAKK